MLVKRNLVSRDSEMVLPTHRCCPGARKSASAAWPIILLVITVGALVVRTVIHQESEAPAELASAARCVDKMAHCHDWAQRGECRSNAQFMAANCAASCKLCSDVLLVRRDGAASPTSNRAAAAAAPAATATAAKQPDAQDDRRGPEVVALGPGLRSWPEAVQQPLSAAAASGDCEDTHTRCDDWRQTGECDTNPSFMYRACRRSCGLCGVAAAAA